MILEKVSEARVLEKERAKSVVTGFADSPLQR
jgi:hypothetical protein